MRKLLLCILIIFLIFSQLSKLFGQIPQYFLTARNLHLVAPDSLWFDIYLLNINYHIPFDYAHGQYFMSFNPNFGNGGTLSFRLLETEPGDCLTPGNLNVSSGTLRFSSTTFPGPGNGCIISHSGLGSLLGRFSLRTSNIFMPIDSFKLKWQNPQSILSTKIFAYIGTTNVEITNPANHFIDLLTNIEHQKIEHAEDFELFQNYPNPFNPVTIIAFTIPRVAQTNSLCYVQLSVYDVTGKEVTRIVDEYNNVGYYEVEWDGSEFGSGIYFYKLEIENGGNKFSDTKRMMLLK
ncbi:MAG: hypothetical protein HGGPFJEG_02276 [Ignavibacteria bacterium]|nr:hypothetical protein [Ignavibacteria bacterium]